MTSSEPQSNENRNWFKIATLALLPTLAAGLIVILMSSGDSQELSVEETTTTTLVAETTTTEQTPGDFELPEAKPVDLPEDEPEVEEDSEEEEEPAPELPAPAELEISASAGVDDEGYGVIEVSNVGESTLEIYTVDTHDYPIQMGEGASEMDGGSSQEIEFHVDTSELPIGAWEMTISFYTNGGEGHVKVEGFKWFVVQIAPPDLDISSPYVVPHQVNAVVVKIVNNQNYNVTVGLSSESSRLSFPDEVELEPGENEIFVAIQALPVNPAAIQVLGLDVNWGETELGTVTIVKHGS